MSATHQKWLEITIIFLIVLGAYSYFNRDKNLRDHSVESRLALVKAIVDEQRFEIDSYHVTLFATRDKAYYNGHYYSDKAVGASLLGAITYKAASWISAQTGWVIRFKFFRDLITILTICPLAAVLAPLLYLLVRQISPAATAGQALFITLAIAVGTPFFKFATLFYGHTLAGTFLLLSFYIWFTYHQSGAISWARIFFSGFLMGWMIITEYPTVLLAAALGLYILFALYKKQRLRDWRVYGLLAAGALIPTSFLLFYNYAAFGNMFSPSYAHEAMEVFSRAHARGLFGVGAPRLSVVFYMTFHPTMGIFWQSPVLLLAFPGWYLMLRSEKYKAEGWFSLLTACLYVVFFSGYYMWWGGSSFTPRHLIPVLPLFVLPLAFLPRRFFPFVFITGLISIAQNLIVAAGNSEGLGELVTRAFWVTPVPAYQGSTIYDIFFSNLVQGDIVHNLGESIFGLSGYMSFLPWIIFEIIAITIFLVISKSRLPFPEASSSEAASLDLRVAGKKV